MRCPAAGALYPGVWARTGLIVVKAGEPIDAMSVGSPAALRDRRRPHMPFRSQRNYIPKSLKYYKK